MGVGAMFEIDLEWAVASEYILRPVGRGSTRDVAIYPAEGSRIVRYRPLEQHPALYAEFAKLEGSEKTCLEFAHRYGLLHTNLTRPLDLGNDPGAFETLRIWKGHIADARDIIHRCELSRTNPSEAFQRFVKRDKSLFGFELYLSIRVLIRPPHSTCAASLSPALLSFKLFSQFLAGANRTNASNVVAGLKSARQRVGRNQNSAQRDARTPITTA